MMSWHVVYGTLRCQEIQRGPFGLLRVIPVSNEVVGVHFTIIQSLLPETKFGPVIGNDGRRAGSSVSLIPAFEHAPAFHP